MSNNFYGYQPYFMGLNNLVYFPQFSHSLSRFVAKTASGNDILNYQNYSVVHHAKRGFPMFTAANIEGEKIKKIPRKEVFENGRDNWSKDQRINKEYQWGKELYKADFSDFDRGHMVKREDVQWGNNIEMAKNGAQSTFYYTNSVPQRKEINRSIWLKIENYILHDEATHHNLKINLFTGPVLKDDDPIFVTEVRGRNVQIPTLFWKVIYYITASNQLARTGFLVGQKHLLEINDIVYKSRSHSEYDSLFMNFESAETFQVNVATIEELTGLYFVPALDVYQDERPSHLVLEEVNVRSINGNVVKPIINGLKLI